MQNMAMAARMGSSSVDTGRNNPLAEWRAQERARNLKAFQRDRSKRWIRRKSLESLTVDPSWRQRVFLLLDDPTESRLARNIAIFIMLVIILSCISFVVETLPAYRQDTEDDPENPVFAGIEFFSIAVFSLEYLLRLLCVSAMPNSYLDDPDDDDYQVDLLAGPPTIKRDNPPVVPEDDDAEVPDRSCCCACYSSMDMRKVRKFVRQPLNVIDLVAILPFYISIIAFGGTSGSGFAVVRVLRLARVLRIFKLGKYSHSLQTFVRVMKRSMTAMYMMIFFVFIAVILFGSMIYFAEQGTYDEATGKYMRPDKIGSGQEESPFTSIPASFWWVVVTITTVGYGDLAPTTPWGKVVGALTMHVGILVLALPITIIGTNFTEEFVQMKRERMMEEEEEARRQREADGLPRSSGSSISTHSSRSGNGRFRGGRRRAQQRLERGSLGHPKMELPGMVNGRVGKDNTDAKSSNQGHGSTRVTATTAAAADTVESVEDLRALVVQMKALVNAAERILALHEQNAGHRGADNVDSADNAGVTRDKVAAQ